MSSQETETSKTKIAFDYDEANFLKQTLEHCIGTYSGPYKGNYVMKISEELGEGLGAARKDALKYLYRYGKKDGYNKVDLFKAIHYIIMMWEYSKTLSVQKQEEKTANASSST